MTAPIGSELEELLRRLIREELTKLNSAASDSVDPSDEVRVRAVERAAKLRAARKADRR